MNEENTISQDNIDLEVSEANEAENINEENSSENTEKKSKSFMSKKKENSEIQKLKKQIEEMQSTIDEQSDKYSRLAAEYDNYRKRTSKEMEQRYNDAKSDVWKNLLSVVDDFERVLSVQIPEECSNYSEGVNLIYKKLTDIMKSTGIEEIKALNEQFDPEYHNAVMHIESDEAGENEIVEVFMKGYKLDDKVIRCSMVKVAN